MPLIHLWFFFLPFSPQALQPNTEKACRAQGTGQRAELPVYSCQNTGGWVNLLCATDSIAEHFDGRVSLPVVWGSFFFLCALCVELCSVEHNHNAEATIRRAANPAD